MRIINKTRNTIISYKCKVADSFWSRFIGLIGRKELPKGSALLIIPCNSIHMFFMKFPIDLIFIDKNSIVVQTVQNIRPWSISKIVKSAHCTIELPVGTVLASKTKIGDKLDLLSLQ